VHSLFRRYVEAGTVVRVKQQLDAQRFRIPIRIDGAGRSTGGGLPSRGHIHEPDYVGRISHKGQFTKASIRRSCPKTCGTRCSKACAIIGERPGQRS
jgi:hypothetical protein